jgi:hypothetical protein
MEGLLRGDHPRIKKPAEKAEDRDHEHHGGKMEIMPNVIS